MDRATAMAALAACAIAWTGAAMADPGTGDTQAPRYVSLTIDNDFFVGGDSHYTDGIQVAVLVDRRSLPAWLTEAGPFRWGVDPGIMFAVGQRIYTPADTDAVHPDPRDRPYAGWLYLSTDIRTRSDTAIDHVSFSLGVIGSASLAGRTQNNAHHLFHSRVSRGWDAQLGTEPTLMAGFERAWPGVLRGNGHWDVSPRIGATVGNVMTYASTGVVARWGRNLPADIPVTHISLGPPRDGYRGNAVNGWYAWLGVDARAVARNVFLDGNTWKNSPSVERKSFGYDVEAGLAWAWQSGRVGFTFIRRSEEFKTQKRADRFGQLTVSLPY